MRRYICDTRSPYVLVRLRSVSRYALPRTTLFRRTVFGTVGRCICDTRSPYVLVRLRSVSRLLLLFCRGAFDRGENTAFDSVLAISGVKTGIFLTVYHKYFHFSEKEADSS